MKYLLLLLFPIITQAETCFTDNAKVFHLNLKPTTTVHRTTIYNITGYTVNNNTQYPISGSAIKTNGILSFQTITSNPQPFLAYWDQYTNSNISFNSKEIINNSYTITNPVFTKIPCN